MAITKDLEKYFKNNFSGSISTLSDCSKSDNGMCLVNNTLPAYNFDDIISKITVDKFDSLDCVVFAKRDIYFVEFKSGFVDKISSVYEPQNYDCQNCNSLHLEYFNQLTKRRKAEKEVLHKNLQLKIAESLYILKNCILPKCEDSNVEMNLKFVCVIDEGKNPLLSLGVGLSKLSKTPNCNCLTDLLKKYGRENRFGERPFFDEIKVMTAGEFENCSKFN